MDVDKFIEKINNRYDHEYGEIIKVINDSIEKYALYNNIIISGKKAYKAITNTDLPTYKEKKIPPGIMSGYFDDSWCVYSENTNKDRENLIKIIVDTLIEKDMKKYVQVIYSKKETSYNIRMDIGQFMRFIILRFVPNNFDVLLKNSFIKNGLHYINVYIQLIQQFKALTNPMLYIDILPNIIDNIYELSGYQKIEQTKTIYTDKNKYPKLTNGFYVGVNGMSELFNINISGIIEIVTNNPDATIKEMKEKYKIINIKFNKFVPDIVLGYFDLLTSDKKIIRIYNDKIRDKLTFHNLILYLYVGYIITNNEQYINMIYLSNLERNKNPKRYPILIPCLKNDNEFIEYRKKIWGKSIEQWVWH